MISYLHFFWYCKLLFVLFWFCVFRLSNYQETRDVLIFTLINSAHLYSFRDYYVSTSRTSNMSINETIKFNSVHSETFILVAW